MSDERQATPEKLLREYIMNPNTAKNEHEWWAHHEINRQQAEIDRLRGEVVEQSRLRDHFGEQARHWEAECWQERQRARRAAEMIEAMHIRHQFGGVLLTEINAALAVLEAVDNGGRSDE